MDREIASYIVKHYGHLLNDNEKLAIKHISHLVKLEDMENPEGFLRKQLYEKQGWLTRDPEVLGLLSGGYDQFELDVASRIMEQDPGKIFLNKCPGCGKLARTPKARQCRYCGRNWH